MSASSDDRGNERSGGNEPEEEARTDGWMATYSDMVTLLMTFFVLMFALSNVDNARAEMFLFAMSRGGITAEQFIEIQERYELDELAPGGEWDDMFPAPGWEDEDNVGDEEEGDEEEEEGETAGERALRELYEAIGLYIASEGLGNELELSYTGEFLMLTITSDVWFDSGRADIRPEMRERGVVLARLLVDNFDPFAPFEIIVAGHTDNVPMRSPQFATNWELSNARATNFLRLLMDESELPPQQFLTYALGEYRPIDDNNTPEGRQRNRRVEIMIQLARENPFWDVVFDG